MSVIVDSREPEELKKSADIVDTIDVDYLIEGSERSYCVERKTISDLLSSVRDGRLWKQLEAMAELKKQNFKPMLVIEGNLWLWLTKYKKITLKQWLGILIGVVGYSVPIILVSSKKQFTLLLDMLKKKAGEKKEYVKPTISKPERSLAEEREDMFAAVDMIGRKTAHEIIEKWKIPKTVCEQSLASLCSFLGEKRGKHLAEVLGIEK